MKFGDIVIPVGDIYRLHCGSGIYTHAIVIKTDPLVLVSEESDMRWDQVDPSEVRVIGRAKFKTIWRCLRRWKR